MTNYKYLIIGGGVAGTTAADNIRQLDAEGSIAIVGDEPYPFYSKVMLSKPEYFMGKIPEEKIFLKQPNWYGEKKIDYITGKQVTSVDPKSKTITLNDNLVIQYDKLLIATGNTPRAWDIPGAEKDGIFSLRRLDDYKKIKSFIPNVKNAVSIGGGFISFEMCEIMNRLGISVTLIIRENYFWEPILDKESATIAEKAMEAKGIKIIRNAEVQEVTGDTKVSGLVLKNGESVACDMVIVSIGNYCNLEFLKTSGIELSRGIITDEYLKTNVTDVWAAGDVADYSDLILEEQVELGNWVNAQVQGKIAGLNMAGKPQPFKLVSSCNAHGFESNITFVGDIRPEKNKKVILRKSLDSKNIIQLFIKFGELIGATFVNGAEELPTVCKLIETDTKLTGFESQLSDPSFDLKGLMK
ncbi:MAG: FAD-dependent oxidoreductase [bacterium]|nr:FAD-dependent oxidoreductase [bacterium]